MVAGKRKSSAKRARSVDNGQRVGVRWVSVAWKSKKCMRFCFVTDLKVYLGAVLRLIRLLLRFVLLLFHVFCYPSVAVVMCQRQQALVALARLNQHTGTKGVVLSGWGGGDHRIQGLVQS